GVVAIGWDEYGVVAIGWDEYGVVAIWLGWREWPLGVVAIGWDEYGVVPLVLAVSRSLVSFSRAVFSGVEMGLKLFRLVGSREGLLSMGGRGRHQ
ncbi:unnamed protein product, partial [Staurois parvus]